jgi:hypothetical protein
MISGAGSTVWAGPEGAGMRWDDLFGDLEAQWEAEERRALDAEVADRTRRERALVGLYDRFAAAAGSDLTLGLRTGRSVTGQVADVGEGWVLLKVGSSRALVPFGGLTGVVGLGPRADARGVGRKFGLGFALRGLSRDRAVVRLTDVSGAQLTGTIDAVGQDFLELAEHPTDVPRRTENLTGRRVVPFTALALVQPG